MTAKLHFFHQGLAGCGVKMRELLMTKLEELQEKLKSYEAKLAEELKGYRGVIHENAASEIKHAKVMVYQGMVNQLKEEIEKLKAGVTS